MKDKLKKYLDSYLNNNYVGMAASSSMESLSMKSFGMKRCAMEEVCEDSNISSFIEKNKEEDTFQSKLLKMIDERNLKDSDVYNKVNIDRRLFSKIRSNRDYHPSKETIILLGISLKLTEQELEELLSSASYSLPMNNEFDLIIRFCFKEKIYDLLEINEFLEDYHCKILGE